MIASIHLGHIEDWSVKLINPVNNKSVCIIDTGGTYQLINNLETYEATGATGGLPVFLEYNEAFKEAERRLA